MTNRLYAEFLGTAWLVLGGCGSAVLAAAFPGLGIGFMGVALAFGLTVVTMAYVAAPISGAHFNPAVTVGLACGGRFPWSEVVQYVVAQVLGGIVGAAILYVVVTGRPDTGIGSFATNGFGEHSPGGYGLIAAAVTEVVMTFGFVTVILGVTDKRAVAFSAAAPLAIGLALTLIHLISIPVTNTAVNPARSTAPALFVGGAALAQLWLFWVAPLVGGAIAGFAYGLLGRKD
ncbi:MAG: aquaporin Z [Reyranella sp.]|nr:aquaporin Z [Reyranella sp.]